MEETFEVIQFSIKMTSAKGMPKKKVKSAIIRAGRAALGGSKHIRVTAYNPFDGGKTCLFEHEHGTCK